MNILLLFFIVAGLQQREIAVLIKSKGSVLIVKSGKSIQAKRGNLLNEGDEIRTGKDGFALIKYLNKGAIIQLRKNSSISFPTSKKSFTINRIKLFFGEIISIIKGKRFEVETPNAVAAVKGTKFIVGVYCDTTYLDVTEGEVKFSSKGGEETFGPGESARCIGDNPPERIHRRKNIIIEFKKGGEAQKLEIKVK